MVGQIPVYTNDLEWNCLLRAIALGNAALEDIKLMFLISRARVLIDVNFWACIEIFSLLRVRS
jgi:hypothetical protein